MTISNTKAKSVYETNGERREWEIGFDFDSNVSKLNIILEDSEGYQTVVEDNYLIEDGVVVYPSLESELDPVAEGYKIILIRETENNQEIDYRDNLVEQGLDKLTLQVQEIAEEVNRAIKVPVSKEDLSQYKNPILEIREETEKSLNEIQEATSIVADYAQVSSSHAVTSKEEADRAVEASNVSVMASSDAEAFATMAENLANEAHNAVSAYVNGLGAMRNAVLDLGVFEDNQRRASSSIIDFDFEPLDVFVRFSDSEKKMWIKGSHSFAGIEKVGEKKYKIFYSVSSEDFASQSAIKGPFYVQYVIKYSVFSGKPVVYRGRVDSVDQLPETAEDGDLWYVGPVEQENKEEYVWQGGKWELLGSTDFTNIYTKEEIDNKVIVIEADIDANADAIQKTRSDFMESDSELQQQINAHATEITTLKNDTDELGDQVAEIESKIPESTSDTNPLINKQQLDEAIQGGGGGGSVPDNVYTEDNLVAGENVTFDKKSGTDDNTVALFHFDGNAKDTVSGNELSESPVIATEGKFGSGSLKARENWFNSVSFAKSIDPKTTPFTLEFWHKQVAGSVMGSYGDETTIVLAPTAPNNTASKSQWVGLFMLPDGTNNKIQLQIGDSRLGEFRTNNYTTLGEYNHYALTWDPSTQYFKLYMNGTYVDQYQYYYYNSLPILGGIGMFKYTTGTDDNTVAQAYIDELRFSDTVRYTGSFTVATEAFPSDKLKTVVNVNVPESGFNKDNLLGGKDIEIIPEPVEGGIDEHTVACWHFDEDKLDVVGGEEWKANYSNITNAYSKFGGKSIYANKYAFSTGISASGLSGWTIDGWILFTGTENTQFATGSYVSNYISFTGLRADISRTRIILGQYRGTIDKTFTFDTSLSTNTWYHLAVQLKDGKFQAFINGKKVAEIDWTTAVTTNFGFYQGGYLDEVRISDVARYDGDFTPPTKAYSLAVPTGNYLVNYTGESGAGKNIGEVYYSQSSLATDNAGALPLFTGETITSADTIYPDFYKWVTEHTELQATAEEYETAITNYGECPKYVLSDGSLRLPKKSLSHGTVIKEKKPTDLDPTWYRQWSDGWLEQGGFGQPGVVITFLKPFLTISNLQVTPDGGTNGSSATTVSTYNISNTNFSFTTASNSQGGHWIAEGQGVDGAQDETLYPWIFAYSAAIPASTAQAAAFQEAVSSLNEFKANKDLTNVDKSLLISYGTPDFTARIDNSVNTEYTAERAGILIGKLGAGGNYGSAVLTIDGLDFPLQSNGETWGSYQFPFCIPVGQGSVYNLTASCAVSAFYFIPLKGVL